MTHADNITKKLDKMNFKSTAAMRKKILSDASQAMEQTINASANKPSVGRIIMKSNITKFATAAVLIIAVFIGMNMLNGTPAYAIEQTVEALKGVSNFRITMKMGPKSVDMLMLINQQTGLADHIRMDAHDSGDVTITIPGQTYIYNKQKNEVTFLPQELLRNDLNFKDVINSVVEQTNAVDGRIEILNKFSDLAGKEVVFVTIIRKDESIAGQFLIDPDTNLPIYLGIDTGGKLNYMGPFEYEVNIPEDAFEFIIPQGAKVTDR